jgi:hypothetical protein
MIATFMAGYAEDALGQRGHAGRTRIDLDRLTERTGETLEAGFDHVMVVLAVKVFDEQGRPRRPSPFS